jgi:hypothetical protein
MLIIVALTVWKLVLQYMSPVFNVVTKSICYCYMMVKSVYLKFVSSRGCNIFYDYTDHPLLLKICCSKNKSMLWCVCCSRHFIYKNLLTCKIFQVHILVSDWLNSTDISMAFLQRSLKETSIACQIKFVSQHLNILCWSVLHIHIF